MKKLILILITLSSLNILAQKKAEVFFKGFVECYYSDKETEPISICENPNGKTITELSVLTKSNCWYKFAISESKNGYLKIENIIVFPACEEDELNENIDKYKGKWVSSEKMKISTSDLDVEPKKGVPFYKKADLNSDLVYQSGKYLETDLIEIDGLWAKVSFVVNEKRIIGWLERKDQCAYPWTSCPFITK